MKHNAKKRTLRLEQLENRALLSATTWDNAAQADAAVAAEMAAILNETAPIDLTSAFSSAAETEAPLEIEVDTTAQNAAAQLKDAVEQIAEDGVITLTNGGTIELSEVLTITKTLSIVADDNATILNQEGCGFAVSNSATLEVSGVCFENPSSDLFNVVSGASAIVRDSVFSGEFGEWVIELDEGGAYKSIGNIYNQTDGPALFHVGDGSQIDMANDVVRTTTALVNGKNVSGVEITVTNSTIDLQNQYSSIINGIQGTVTLNNSLLIGVVNVKSGTVNANNVLIYGSFTGKAEKNLNEVETLGSTKGLFVDYDHGNYRLAEGSKAIEAGNNGYVGDLVKDLAGNNRIAGNNVDLGAYEYGAGPYVDSTPLNAPTLTAEAVSPSKIQLTFDNLDPNASGYVYQISTTDGAWSDDAWISAELSETGTLTVSGLDPTTTYYFVAKAVGTGDYVDSEVSETSATTKEVVTIVVDTANDVDDEFDGLTSLREAVEAAGEGDVIVFDKSLKNETITLETPIVLDKDVTIDASKVYNYGANDGLITEGADGTRLTIDGQGEHRLFEVSEGVSAEVIGVHFANGALTDGNETGGAIYVEGSLDLYDCYVSGSEDAIAVVGSGATLDATRVVFENNSGDALYVADGADVTVVDGFFRDNAGSAVVVEDSTYSSVRSEYSGNAVAGSFSNSTVYMATELIFDNGVALAISGGDVTVVNTTIAGNDSGISLSDGGDLALYNTIVVENGGSDVAVSGDATVVGKNSLTTFDAWSSGSANNVVYNGAVDALFEDLAGGDLHIKKGSQAYDAGDDSLALDAQGSPLVKDWAGNVLLGVGDSVDIGALECGAMLYYGLEMPFPLTFDAFDLTTKQLPMNWSFVEGATRYRVEAAYDVATADDSFFFSTNLTDISRVATLSYVGRAYTFRVRAEIATGAEPDAFSEWVYATFDPAAPTQPGAIVFGDYDPTTGRLEMSWGDSLDETYYRVEYSRDGGKTWNNSGVVDADVTERVATLGYRYSEYMFRVCAVNDVASSAWTYGTFKTGAPTQPGPIEFGAYDQETGRLEMSWGASTGETYYRVEYSRDGGNTWNNSGVVDANVTERVATLGYRYSEYMFRVCAVNGVGSSEWTVGAFTPPVLGAPSGPTSVVFDSFDASTGALVMSWTGVSSTAEKIRVEFTYDGGATWSHSQTLSGDATGRVAKIGWPSRTYQFRVCAINDANENAPSSWVWAYSEEFKASDWNAEPVSDAVSVAFAELFSDDSDDFWSEF